MSWRLVFTLSLFGAAMGIATVYVVPSTVEPLFWLAIFALCAWTVARRVERLRFLHGLALGIANSIWITSAHVLLFDAYVARHPREVEAMANMPLPPRVMMAVTGPVIGVASGVVIGLLALGAGWLVKPRRALE
jgi:hypothetical protein